MRIDEVQLIELLPRFMRGDRVARALCAALEPMITRLVQSPRDMRLFFYDDMPEKILDEMAWQRNVAWYDNTAEVEIKRALIRSVFEIYRSMGTKSAIERAVADYFGDAIVEEWWEYGAEPYHFRIHTTNPDAAAQNGARLRRVVELVKRASAVLDGIYVISSGSAPHYVGGFFQVYEHITLAQR